MNCGPFTFGSRRPPADKKKGTACVKRFTEMRKGWYRGPAVRKYPKIALHTKFM